MNKASHDVPKYFLSECGLAAQLAHRARFAVTEMAGRPVGPVLFVRHCISQQRAAGPYPAWILPVLLFFRCKAQLQPTMPKASWLVQRQLPAGGVMPTGGGQVVRKESFAVIRLACFVGKSAGSVDFGCHRPEALAS